jgi:ABC-2 type transport system permease protein
LPITDAETVVSKLLTVGLAIPLIAFVVIVVTHLVNLVLLSIFVNIEGGSPVFMVWNSVPLLDVWATLLIVMLALPIWFSPFVGWFLFVSAWTKRMPFLTAFLPLVVLPMLEYFVFRSHVLASAIQGRFHEMPIVSGIDPSVFLNEEALTERTQAVSLFSFLDIGKFLTSPAMWGGVLVCGVFITAAIYIRRYRDDT